MKERRRTVLVGSSFHFMSGLSVYTCRLANELTRVHEVGVILLDRLIPERFYPGGSRAGKELAGIDYDPAVRRLGRLDWWWGPRMIGVLRALKREQPDQLVFQWWTAATLHTYLALAFVARRLSIPVVIEFHEVQDTGEARVPFVGLYARLGVPALVRLASGAVVHNEHDRRALLAAYGEKLLRHLDVVIAAHGPYDHFLAANQNAPDGMQDPSLTQLLFFGTIRPYKGLEDLVEVFNAMTPEEVAGFHLTVVGETWEGHTLPGELIEASPHRDRITFVNRYVTDEEASDYVNAADVMVLPARRGSASGPLQIAMSAGLHVVKYAVGGLVDAVKDYAGATLVTPNDKAGLKAALFEVAARKDERFEDPHSWDKSVEALDGLAQRLSAR